MDDDIDNVLGSADLDADDDKVEFLRALCFRKPNKGIVPSVREDWGGEEKEHGECCSTKVEDITCE